MFEGLSSTGLVERLCAASRTENQAAGQRLAVIGELDLVRLRQVGERETWCTDTQEAITAEVAAALTITQGLAASYLCGLDTTGTDEFSAAIPRAATGHSPERNGTTMSTKRENRPSWLDYNTKINKLSFAPFEWLSHSRQAGQRSV